jgi:hypothetical protein
MKTVTTNPAVVATLIRCSGYSPAMAAMKARAIARVSYAARNGNGQSLTMLQMVRQAANNMALRTVGK